MQLFRLSVGCLDPDALDQDLKKLKEKNLLGEGTYEVFHLNLKVRQPLLSFNEYPFRRKIVQM